MFDENAWQNVISSYYHIVGSAIWDIFVEIFYIARAPGASAIYKIEKNIYHIARSTM